jgi:dihydrofolate reductase
MIRHIVVLDAKRGIAKNGKYEWTPAADKRYFNQQTLSHGGVVLMGRKTFFEDVRRPLPGRENFVLSHQDLAIPGVTVIHDLQAFLASKTDVWIIGGAELFAETLPLADELYVTELEGDFDCDQFYPSYKDAYRLVSKSESRIEKGVRYSFCLYKSR